MVNIELPLLLKTRNDTNAKDIFLYLNLEGSSYMNFNFEMFSVWICLSIVEYQYLCVVNLSRRQTLIKIFTKYLPEANINIFAIFPNNTTQLHTTTHARANQRNGGPKS